MNNSIRLRTENQEFELLSPYATKSANTKGRLVPIEECAVRTPFQRDRDRILHCKTFRRLKHKTQVFLSPRGDHYRTRLTHTLEVSQIARTISRSLRLNEDLTEAVALGHDLGHTPYGHAGERALDNISPLGFAHFKQSLRVVDKLENDGKGLNLTYETRNGIVCHTKGKEAETPEGRVVRIADKIAYINHDIDDAIRAGVLSESDIPLHIRDGLGHTRSDRIDTLVFSLINFSVDSDVIAMDEQTNSLFEELHAFMFDFVYTNPIAKGEEGKVDDMIIRMYKHFIANPEQMENRFNFITHEDLHDEKGLILAVCDFISGMTDNYATQVYGDLFIPKSWQGINTF